LFGVQEVEYRDRLEYVADQLFDFSQNKPEATRP